MWFVGILHTHSGMWPRDWAGCDSPFFSSNRRHPCPFPRCCVIPPLYPHLLWWFCTYWSHRDHFSSSFQRSKNSNSNSTQPLNPTTPIIPEIRPSHSICMFSCISPKCTSQNLHQRHIKAFLIMVVSAFFVAGDATVTIAHRCTPKEQLKELTRLADIIVAAAGKWLRIKEAVTLTGCKHAASWKYLYFSVN